MATCPVYPPGVLQTFTIPDPTSLDGFGDLEITLIPSQGVTDINHISAEGINAFKEMLYEADEDFRYMKFKEMCEIQDQIQAIEERAEGIWRDNAIAASAAYQPSLWYCNWSPETDAIGFEFPRSLPAPWDIRIALDEAEEDADYEEWVNSKQYVESLKEYNRHMLLAWNKDLEGEHPKWSGEYKEIEEMATLLDTDANLSNSYIKERYRVEVYVHTLNWGQGGRYYAYGSTPYGDVYIPQKIAEFLKDLCGIYEMDIALQDVERRGEGARLRSFPWTGIYLYNRGLSLE
jgi:hypothetical protein